MTAIPHEFLRDIAFSEFNTTLPEKGKYAVGNVFLNPDPEIRQKQKIVFTELAQANGLNVLVLFIFRFYFGDQFL